MTPAAPAGVRGSAAAADGEVLEAGGDVPWARCFRILDTIGYAGPDSLEWEDAGMDRLVGAPEALALVRRLACDAPEAASEAAFDAAFSTRG